MAAPVTEPGDSAHRAGETPQARSAPDGESAPPAGPPDDATTTYEELPGDLFGETEPPASSEPHASDPRPATREPARAPRHGEQRDEGSRRANGGNAGGGGANDRNADGADATGPGATGPGTDGPRSHDPAIDMVRTFFPGRIVALEPVADGPEGGAAEDEVAEERPDESANGGPDDGAPRPSG